MCIIFVYACKEPEDNCEGYSLIVANNRDEFLDRPTKEISFLDEQQNIICGKTSTKFFKPNYYFRYSTVLT